MAVALPPHREQIPEWMHVGTALGLSAALAGSVWVAHHVHPDETLHEVALFAHLASLVLGFGSVLAIDWVGLQWALGRQRLTDVLTVADHVQAPIWLGLAGLVVSGVLLEPDASRTLTQVKLGLVMLVTWNGLVAGLLHRRLSAGTDSRRVLLVAALTAGVSQAGWWGAMTIGFLNH